MSPEHLTTHIDDREYLYRGIVENFWNYERGTISSAAFKDKNGTSVDRDAGRDRNDCIRFLQSKKSFFAIFRVKTFDVRAIQAIVEYLPTNENIFHSEIHDSPGRPQIRSSKANKISRKAEMVFKP